MRGDKEWQEEKVVYHLFLQISLVPHTGNCFVFLFFQHFLGQKLFLLLSSGVPPSVLSPEASNSRRLTQTGGNLPPRPALAYPNTNNSKTDAQTFAPL